MVVLNYRTGKRTVFGALMDGWNSTIRYYKNNFSDGFRQVSRAVWAISNGKLLEFIHIWSVRVICNGTN